MQDVGNDGYLLKCTIQTQVEGSTAVRRNTGAICDPQHLSTCETVELS